MTRGGSEMDGANPYLPPQASIADGGRAVSPAVDPDAEPALPPWRLEGRTLFARHGVTLPDICLFTGEQTKPAQRRRVPLSWTPFWFMLVVFTAPMAAAMTYSALRRPSNIEHTLGLAGQRRDGLCRLLCLAAMLDGITLFFLLTLRRTDPTVSLLLFLALVGLIAAVLALRVFSVAKIDRRYARLRLRPRVADAFARLPTPPPSA